MKAFNDNCIVVIDPETPGRVKHHVTAHEAYRVAGAFLSKIIAARKNAKPSVKCDVIGLPGFSVSRAAALTLFRQLCTAAADAEAAEDGEGGTSDADTHTLAAPVGGASANTEPTTDYGIVVGIE